MTQIVRRGMLKESTRIVLLAIFFISSGRISAVQEFLPSPPSDRRLIYILDLSKARSASAFLGLVDASPQRKESHRHRSARNGRLRNLFRRDHQALDLSVGQPGRRTGL